MGGQHNNNNATLHGGGVYVSQSQGAVLDFHSVNMQNNYAAEGGGLYYEVQSGISYGGSFNITYGQILNNLGGNALYVKNNTVILQTTTVAASDKAVYLLNSENSAFYGSYINS